MQLNSHVKGKHELVLLKEAATHIGVEKFEEVLLQLLYSPLDVFGSLIDSEGLRKELTEPSHRELIHGVQLTHFLNRKVQLRTLLGDGLEVLSVFFDALLKHLCGVQLLLDVISDLLGLV